jgi:serine/threonine protein phosphatase PrpC
VHEAKNTARALVNIGYDGRVHKYFRAADAQSRFDNEVRVLQYLERRGCDFVPRVLSFDREKLELVTTNCGARVDQLTDDRLKELFAELETFGVRHEDPFLRNITYRASDGRFCIIDFEFATILEPDAESGEGFDARAAKEHGEEADSTTLKLRWSATTECGPIRGNNEDQLLIVAFNTEEFTYLPRENEVHVGDFDFVFAVSDGMGGEKSGEFASKFAVDNITRLLPRRFRMPIGDNDEELLALLDELFQGIHRQLTMLGESYDEGHNMGATLSLIWYIQGWCYFGHIGDSRIYHLPRGGGLRQVSSDDTHVGWLRRSGQINEREARFHPRKNVLSQSLGAGNQFVRPQVGVVKAEPGDQFLLCTDGVTDGLWDHALEDLLREAPKAGDETPAAVRIVSQSLVESGRDNATAVVVEIVR